MFGAKVLLPALDKKLRMRRSNKQRLLRRHVQATRFAAGSRREACALMIGRCLCGDELDSLMHGRVLQPF